ncbi:FK506-binding protein 3-like [Syzygium oleosum]|uniref:FK506-binding protein 3-like n=1 Tax=Syzygium oleosum TaxID=219896 RepID=UPI0024B89185|nr:FK506-binding protein 3-like [Syzygium oleosum]
MCRWTRSLKLTPIFLSTCMQALHFHNLSRCMQAFHFRNPSGGQHTMGNRRFRQFPTSDDEEDEPHPRKRVTRPSKNPAESEAKSRSKRRKPVKLVDDDKDEDGYGGEPEADQEGGREEKSAKSAKRKREKEEEEEEEEEEEHADEDVKVVGLPYKSSGKGSRRRRHYLAFEYHGDYYKLEDTILVDPAETDHKPYVAIIKPYGLNVGPSERGTILKGLDLGAQGMRVGSQRLLIVPPRASLWKQRG